MIKNTYIYCNFPSRKAVVVPSSWIDELLHDLHDVAEETRDWDTYNSIMNKLEDGEPVYVDEPRLSYIQRLTTIADVVTGTEYNLRFKTEIDAKNKQDVNL